MLVVGKHLIRAVLALFFASCLVFTWQQLVPMDPALIIGDKPPTMEELQRRLARESYGDWLTRMLSGELGASLFFKRSVADLIGTAVPASLQLVLMTMVLAGVLGGVLGALARAMPRTASNGLAAVMRSLPHLVPGLLMILLVVAGVLSLPVSGYVPLARDWQDSIARTIMPAIALACVPAAVLMGRIGDTARPSPGTGRSLPAAIAPGGLEIIAILSGLVVVEMIFNIPGLGRLVVHAALARDFPTLLPLVLLAAVAGIAVIAVADVIRALAERGRADAAPRPAMPGTAAAAPRSLMARAGRSGLLVAGLVLAVLFLALAILGPSLAPFDANMIDPANRLKPAGAGHALGTDTLGRDVLSRLLNGGWPVALVGIVPVAVAVGAGAVLGTLAGYSARQPATSVIDILVMSVMDTMLAFPLLPLAVVLALILGAGFAAPLVAIAVAAIPVVARLVRDHVLRHGVGSGLGGQIAISAMTLIAAAIATACAVSFLGFGPEPPTPSWGGIAGEGMQFARRAPWIVLWPVVAIVWAVLAFNLIAAGLRNVLEGASLRTSGR